MSGRRVNVSVDAAAEFIADRQKVAKMVRTNHDFWEALRAIDQLSEIADAVEEAAAAAHRALAEMPEFDAVLRFVEVDSSWADTLPTCVGCGQEVQWSDALLMPCSTIGPDDEADTMGVVHRRGCQLSPESGSA